MNIVSFEQHNVVIGNKSSVRLNGIVPVFCKTPRPKVLKVTEWDQKGLSAEQSKWAALTFDGSLHLFYAIVAGKITSISLRILITILALYIAHYTQRTQFNAHKPLDLYGGSI